MLDLSDSSEPSRQSSSPSHIQDWETQFPSSHWNKNRAFSLNKDGRRESIFNLKKLMQALADSGKSSDCFFYFQL